MYEEIQFVLLKLENSIGLAEHINFDYKFISIDRCIEF